ncbi:hypothetical protein J437_LFUL008142 [Ladona fulva]|uniref:Uncharacterized protein n=1 Tax=Ladona fulva TaxID=123851 RepID=A0A8K0JUU2_LADFU|nr:hypothetical protein J437_LFUL008142 [Ladona fulva]
MWSIKSPFSEDRRNKTERIQDRRLTENYHGIEWNDGETDHQDVKYILRLFTRCAVVFAKGREKCSFLGEILSLRVIYDLIDLGCPSLKKLKCNYEFDYCWCWNFPKHYASHYQCSKKNCIKLSRWFMTSGKAQLGSSTFCFQTFDKLPYPSKIDVYDMVETGFFYSGYGDTFVCHDCGVDIGEWSPGVDPWMEHRRANPLCLSVMMKSTPPHRRRKQYI